MLVLSRTLEEEIVIRLPDGRDIVIRVIDIRHGHKVQMGFTADEDIKIHRREVVTGLLRSKQAARLLDPLDVVEAYQDDLVEGAAANA